MHGSGRSTWVVPVPVRVGWHVAEQIKPGWRFARGRLQPGPGAVTSEIDVAVNIVISPFRLRIVTRGIELQQWIGLGAECPPCPVSVGGKRVWRSGSASTAPGRRGSDSRDVAAFIVGRAGEQG